MGVIGRARLGRRRLAGMMLGWIASGILAAGCSSGSEPNNTPVPTTVTSTGNQQSATVGTELPLPIGVTVKDQFGHPLPDVAVSFFVTSGGGFLAAALDTTDDQGMASTAWTIGNGVGLATNAASASVHGYTGPAQAYTASGSAIVSLYNINLRILTPMSASQLSAFTSAAARWRSIIIGDLPSVQVVANPGDCFDNSPAMDELVNDIVIFASLDSIDGPGGILGGASPCWVRNPGGLTLVGGMVFDSADMVMLEAQGILRAVVLHEMAHVIGFGSLWNYITPPLLLGAPGDHNFSGDDAVFQFGLRGGASYAGLPVPVENQGGPGTKDVHWRESVMGAELMTGYVSLTANPLSTITIGSLADMGYTVSYTYADPYTVSPVNLRAGPGAQDVHLVELPRSVTIKSVDALGRIRRVR